MCDRNRPQSPKERPHALDLNLRGSGQPWPRLIARAARNLCRRALVFRTRELCCGNYAQPGC